MKNSLFGKDLVTVKDLNKMGIETIFGRTNEMEKLITTKGGDDRLKNKIMAALFFEPSTRTFSSFITAMQRLGGGMIPLNGMSNTSVEKGESFGHTIKVFSRYADCLIVRHPEPGKPSQAAKISDIPVINAGDGINEHPTQALFDTYTILQQFGKLNNLTITMVGDLKNGRTVHSLTQALLKIGNNLRLNFVSPEVLKMPEEIKQIVNSSKSNYNETENLGEVIPDSDVIYMTRVQKERFQDINEYERLKSFYILNKHLMKKAKKSAIVMHPLPIAAGEIAAELDKDPRSVYLDRQLKNGLYLRMALLDLILLP